jgi:hypothetical protein
MAGYAAWLKSYPDYLEDSWVKEVDIDPERVKAIFEGLDREKETLCH